ncbi:MAG: hypothetical protein ABJE95_19580 [Byssovorax sp.]
MPTPYTPASPARPAFPWNLVKDGEVYNFDSIQQSVDPAKGLFAKLMDGIAYLLARVDALAGGITGASLTLVSAAPAIPTLGTWNQVVGSGSGNYSTGAAGNNAIALPLDAASLPDGCTLTGVSVAIAPNNSHASLVGLSLPSIFLYETNTTTGVSTQIGGTVTDSSASFTAYNLPHRISITGLSTTIDRSHKHYQLRFLAETGGANELAGLLVLGAAVTRLAF